MNHTAGERVLLVTGAAGYIGSMLCDQFSRRGDVAKIIALDKDERPQLLCGNEKIIWQTANTADDNWEEEAASHRPDTIIHAAWEIREMYGDRGRGERWNVEGSRRVFAFAFRHAYVQNLIHFSTAAVYGASSDNTISHRFTEDEPTREEVYSYAREKIASERNLRELFEQSSSHRPTVSVVRPAAITGPYGRFGRVRFGLQAALSGKLSGNIFYRMVSLLLSFVPATPWWARQFVHEDDVTDIITMLTFDNAIRHQYEVFNLAPPGAPVLAPHMAHVVGKRTLPVQPWMVRIMFFIFWHLSRGKIPNGPGVWRFYSYPIVLDGKKLTDMYGYHYQRRSLEAFSSTHGRYEKRYVPKEQKTLLIVDGHTIAAEILDTVARDVAILGRRPVLSILTCSPNFETKKYLQLKERKAAVSGITTRIVDVPKDATTEDVLSAVSEAVVESDGIVVQLPFPREIDIARVLASLPPSHDVDALNPTTSAVLSPVVGACETILSRHRVPIAGKNVTIIGYGRLVGKPAKEWFIKKGAAVKVVTEEDEDIKDACLGADIIVCGAGSPGILQPSMIREGVVILDAGTSEEGGVLRGDADPACARKAALFTPVPGGIGPITIAILLQNVLTLCTNRQK